MIAFASSLDQAGPMTRSAEDAAMMLGAMAGFDTRDSTSANRPVDDYVGALGNDVRGLRVGVVREFMGDGLDAGVGASIHAALDELAKLGVELVEVSLPNAGLSVPAYYVVAPAECSSNLARFDGVRYGHRCEEPKDLEDLYKRSRSEGFGAEVKRRIMIGTYALSAGYYDAYYLKAQKVRQLIADDFRAAFEQCDVIASPTAPGTAFKLGDKTDDPVSMYLQDIYTIAVNAMQWETVIGLEIHTQLATESKIFSGAATAFGAEPNTQACAVDLGLPGRAAGAEQRRRAPGGALRQGHRRRDRRALGVRAQELLLSGSAQGLPDQPVRAAGGGQGQVEIVLDDGAVKTIGVTRAHLEEDAGKSLHEDFHGMTGIDLNRAGTPLLEIVSEPDMRSPEEAVAYARKIHQLVRWIGISDGNMQEGSFRVDANISVRPKGQESSAPAPRSRTSTPSASCRRPSSSRSSARSSSSRTAARWCRRPGCTTPDRDETRSMRTKEEANDYRYFPDPDLLPLEIDAAFIAAVATRPAGAAGRHAPPVHASSTACRPTTPHVLTASRVQADYFETVAERLRRRQAGGQLDQRRAGRGAEQGRPGHRRQPGRCAGNLAGLVAASRTTPSPARSPSRCSRRCGQGEGDADEVIEAKGLKQITDTGAIEAMIDDHRGQPRAGGATTAAGKEKLFGFFVGQVMKQSRARPIRNRSTSWPVFPAAAP
jgi:aspartyl-tRNA(Asn)/glutamyl-tRNA(Gln) amidotransferase subunit B